MSKLMFFWFKRSTGMSGPKMRRERILHVLHLVEDLSLIAQKNNAIFCPLTWLMAINFNGADKSLPAHFI